MSIFDSIQKACDDLGELDLSGVKLEDPTPKMLDIQDGVFDEHVAMQPASIAYYGMLMKQAKRELNATERAYDHWKKKAFHESKKELSKPVNGKPSKATIADVESHVLLTNEQEIETWESDIDDLKAKFDVIESWYEAWRQKGFSMRELNESIKDERFSKDHIYEDEKEVVAPDIEKSKAIRQNKEKTNKDESFSRVKRIQRKSKEE
jgi:hypothetical protein